MSTGKPQCIPWLSLSNIYEIQTMQQTSQFNANSNNDLAWKYFATTKSHEYHVAWFKIQIRTQKCKFLLVIFLKHREYKRRQLQALYMKTHWSNINFLSEKFLFIIKKMHVFQTLNCKKQAVGSCCFVTTQKNFYDFWPYTPRIERQSSGRMSMQINTILPV